MSTFASRLRWVLPLALVNTAAYLLVNRHPLFQPAYLPPTPLDRAIPFLAWTVWPYLLLLAADVVLPLLVRERALFKRMLVAYAVAIGANLVIWILLPTAIARPEVLDDTLSAGTYRLLLAVDGPGNCFPSAHVTIPAVAVWALGRERPRWRGPLWALFAVLSLSILTTRQHYVVDLFGGLATGALGVAVSNRLSSVRGGRDV
jgi:hypothetical protein